MIARLLRVALLAAAAVFLLNGCAPAVLMNAAIEQDKHAKTFSPPDNKSLIYVYLDEPTLNVSKHVLIDGRIAGIVRPSLYLMSNVTPGQHRVGLGHMEENSILLDTDQGRMYFITAHVSCVEGKSHAQFEIVDDSTGRQHILASQLANITLFGRPLLNETIARSCGPLLGNT